MLKKGFASLAFASLATIAPINAEEKGTYFVGSIGSAQIQDIDISSALGGGDFEFDSGFSGELGIGYDFGKLRTEITYNGSEGDLDKIQSTTTDISVDVGTWMVSAAYDWRADKKWQPYVGIGIGTAKIEAKDAQTVGSVAIVVDEDNITTVKLKAGVNYETTENLDVYGEIWSQGFDDFTLGTIEFQDTGMTGVSFGMRYKL